MNDSTNSGVRGLGGMERVFIFGTILWLLLLLSRAIAFVLIEDINTGDSSDAWRYPAHLDVFATAFALPLIWAVWARRCSHTWVALVVYWVILIVDRGGNFVTTTFVGRPINC